MLLSTLLLHRITNTSTRETARAAFEEGLIQMPGRIPVQSIDAVLEALGFPATEQRIKGASFASARVSVPCVEGCH